MGLLFNVENWVTWPATLNAGPQLEALSGSLPGSNSTFAELPAPIASRVQFAAEWMYVRSGRQYPGPGDWRYEPTYDDWLRECADTERRRSPQFDRWRRTGQSSQRSRIELGPGPVSSIETVTVNGAAVDAAEYALVDARWLVKVDNSPWPGPPTQPYVSPSPIVVDYVAGAAVPSLLAEAAAIMAHHLVSDQVGGAWKLPKYWQSFTRDNLTVQNRQITDEMIKEAFTGISPILDQTLAMVGPHGIPSARVAVPGRHRKPWRPRAAA